MKHRFRLIALFSSLNLLLFTGTGPQCLTAQATGADRGMAFTMLEMTRDAIKKNLGSIVSSESIILSDGTRKVKVPIRELSITAWCAILVRSAVLLDSGPQSEAGDGRPRSADGLDPYFCER